MGKKVLLIVSMLLAVSAFGKDIDNNYIFSNGKTDFGGYVGMNGKVSSVFSETNALGDIKAAVTFNGKWALGISGTGLHFDDPANQLVSDGSYDLQVNYGGMFIERILSLSDRSKVSLSFLSGQGQASYRYDREYRKEKVWSEEMIDITTFGVQELGVDLHHRIGGNFWLGLTGSYRHTSPLQLIDTSDKLIEGFNGGLSIKYGIF